MPILTTLGAACAKAWGFTSGLVKDQYFNLVSLLLPGNGTNGAQNNTFLDSSTNNFTITRNGNTTQGTFSPFSQTGWGNYFGTSNNLYLNGEAGFAFGSSADFTIEFFFYTNSTSADIVFYDGRPTSTQGAYPTIYLNGTTKVVSYVTSSAERITGTTTISVGVWYHVLLSRSGGNTRLFVNGVQQGSTWPDTTNYINPASRPNIAVSGFSANGYIDGYISNFRVLNGTGFTSVTVPTTPFATNTANQVLLTCQANRFVDSNTTVTAKTINRTGSPSVQAFSPFNPTAQYIPSINGGSGYFDGSGDYLSAASNAAFGFGTGDFTVEAWVYITGGRGERTLFIANATNGANIYLSGTGGTIGIGRRGVDINNTFGSTPTSNSWNHVAIARSGTSISCWVNGVVSGTQSQSNSINYAQGAANIGAISDYADQEFGGYISSLRVVKGTAVYNPASSTITVPTAPLTNITNTSLLLNFTNAGIYDATSKNDLETVGNAQISTTQSKWGGSSMYFDGTGDYLSMPNNDLVRLGGGDFTIEFWANTTSFGAQTYTPICGIWDTNVPTASIASYYVSLNAYNTTYKLGFSYFVSSATDVAFGTATNSTGSWDHYAVVRSGNLLYGFKNGTLLNSGGTAITGTIANAASTDFRIGGIKNGNVYNGYIQDLRITKYARYTANFTAPTAAFPTL
jgi:hypothetical protein